MRLTLLFLAGMVMGVVVMRLVDKGWLPVHKKAHLACVFGWLVVGATVLVSVVFGVEWIVGELTNANS